MVIIPQCLDMGFKDRANIRHTLTSPLFDSPAPPPLRQAAAGLAGAECGDGAAFRLNIVKVINRAG